MTHYLLIGNDTERRVALDQPRLSVGRNADNDLVIEDDAASGYHANFFQVDGELVIVDTGSSNGTYVNGERLAGRRVLRPNDRVRVGDTVLKVFDPSLRVITAEQPAVRDGDLARSAAATRVRAAVPEDRGSTVVRAAVPEIRSAPVAPSPLVEAAPVPEHAARAPVPRARIREFDREPEPVSGGDERIVEKESSSNIPLDFGKDDLRREPAGRIDVAPWVAAPSASDDAPAKRAGVPKQDTWVGPAMPPPRMAPPPGARGDESQFESDDDAPAMPPEPFRRYSVFELFSVLRDNYGSMTLGVIAGLIAVTLNLGGYYMVTGSLAFTTLEIASSQLALRLPWALIAANIAVALCWCALLAVAAGRVLGAHREPPWGYDFERIVPVAGVLIVCSLCAAAGIVPGALLISASAASGSAGLLLFGGLLALAGIPIGFWLTLRLWPAVAIKAVTPQESALSLAWRLTNGAFLGVTLPLLGVLFGFGIVMSLLGLIPYGYAAGQILAAVAVAPWMMLVVVNRVQELQAR